MTNPCWLISHLNTFSDEQNNIIFKFCESLNLQCLCKKESRYCELCFNILRAIKHEESEIIINKNERISVTNLLKYNKSLFKN
jgi:hypothetical protein